MVRKYNNICISSQGARNGDEKSIFIFWRQKFDTRPEHKKMNNNIIQNSTSSRTFCTLYAAHIAYNVSDFDILCNILYGFIRSFIKVCLTSGLTAQSKFTHRAHQILNNEKLTRYNIITIICDHGGITSSLARLMDNSCI